MLIGVAGTRASAGSTDPKNMQAKELGRRYRSLPPPPSRDQLEATGAPWSSLANADEVITSENIG